MSLELSAEAVPGHIILDFVSPPLSPQQPFSPGSFVLCQLYVCVECPLSSQARQDPV